MAVETATSKSETKSHPRLLLLKTKHNHPPKLLFLKAKENRDVEFFYSFDTVPKVITHLAPEIATSKNQKKLAPEDATSKNATISTLLFLNMKQNRDLEVFYSV